ncbi:MAG: GrpB family protein [Candidatus Heimdallarchaeaceae archaeon]
MIGLKRGVVKLNDYDPQWKSLFEKESALILSVAEEVIEDIQHIGSTAIPGVVAKPIIDVLLAINSLSNIKKLTDLLTPIGFVYRGEQGIPDRHLFVKGGEDYRTHHLHVVVKEHSEWLKHILFRDYLRKHPKDVEKYSKLKLDLLKKYEFEREKYTESKSDFIEKILEKAKQNLSI